MIPDADIKREFLAAGFTVEPGNDDLKPYVYEAAHRVLALQEAALRERWRDLLRTPHRMAGGCPDEVAGEGSRDLDCPACRLMQELGA